MVLSNAPNSTHQEGQISLAVQALQSAQITSIRKVAKTYDVPFTTLYARFHGRVARKDCPSNQQKLTPTEEPVLLQQILDMDNHGRPPTTMIIREMADLLLSEHVKSTTAQPLKVGKNWVHNFIQ